MSYTEIYKFNKKGDGEFFDEVKNSHRGALAVWRHLEKKYLPSLPKPKWAKLTNNDDEYYHRGISCLYEKGRHPLQDVWDLVDSKKLTEHEKLVMYSTFDNVVIKKENIHYLIEAFENFEFETSLPEQAEILKNILKDEDCIGIGWNQTSVNGDNWSNYGGYDEETEENIPYNINNGDRHWFLFQ